MPTLDTLTGVDALTSGTAITQTNVTPNLVQAPAAASGTTVLADSSVPSGYTGNAIKIAWTTSAGAGDFRMGLPATGQTASTIFRTSFYYRTTTPTPGADISVFYAYQGGNRAFTLVQRSSTAGFRLLDGNGSGTALDLTGSGTPTWNTWYRIEIQADNTGGPGAAKLVANVYNMAGTLVVSYSNTTTANLGTGSGTFNQWRAGATGYNATAGSHAFYGVRWSDGGTGDIGAFTTPLSTPTVTLGAVTNPTTIGGSNGTQLVTWPAVSGATTYDAYIASNGTPVQGDFTLVASGVTSPYTFTGLHSGTDSFGIMAKP
jgi:hypothetical protein